MMCRDILKEVEPSTVIYNPDRENCGRECVLSSLIPELKTGKCDEWK